MGSIARDRAHNAVFVAAACAFLVFAFFPGRFDGDAISQYRQGLAFRFSDAASVLEAVLLGVLADIGRGPGPMVVLQLLLWSGGLLAFTDALIARGWRVAGQATSLLALTPLLAFDFFDVQRDAMLSALLAVLIGLGARRLLLGARFSLVSGAVALGIFAFALDVRHNALFALAPLWFLFWPVRAPGLRSFGLAALAGAALFVCTHLVLDGVEHGVLKAGRSRFAYSLMLFDLSGVAVRTGEDASEGRLPDFLAEARRCYSPHEWDGFLSGPCAPTGLTAQILRQDPKRQGELDGVWLRQILSHPIAYGAHRARHFGCVLSLGCRRVHQVMTAGWWPRPWDEPNMRTSAAARAIGAFAHALWHSPLGSGALWMLVLAGEAGAAAWVLRRGFSPAPYMALLIAAAGLAYLGMLAVVSIADQMRYLHPVIFLAVLAGPIAVTAVAESRSSRARNLAGLAAGRG